MASKRNLKKYINNLTVELVSECFTFMCFHTEEKYDKAKNVISNVMTERNAIISLANNVPKKVGNKEIRLHFKEVSKRLTNMVTLLDILG